MIKSNLYTEAIYRITDLVKKINPEIGFYLEHFENENTIFLIKLSNGAIYIPIEAIQDFESQPGNITNDRIESIARTFRKIQI